MKLQPFVNAPSALSSHSHCTETCLEFTARLWLRTALVVWVGWLGLLGVLLVR